MNCILQTRSHLQLFQGLRSRMGIESPVDQPSLFCGLPCYLLSMFRLLEIIRYPHTHNCLKVDTFSRRDTQQRHRLYREALPRDDHVLALANIEHNNLT